MKFYRYCLFSALPLLALCGAVSSGQQISNQSKVATTGKDPSTLYLDSWFLMEDAKKLAANGDFMGAIRVSRQADDILAALSRDRADWQQNMVLSRRQENKANIEKWNQEAKNNAAALTGPTPADVERNPAQAPKGNKGSNTAAIPSFDDLDRLRNKNGASPVTPTPRPIDLPETNPTHYSHYEELEARIAKLEIENRALTRAMRDTSRLLENARAEQIKAETGVGVYKAQMQALKEQLAQERKDNGKIITKLTDEFNKMEQLFKEATDRNKRADEEIARLKGQLDETNSQLAIVTKERDEWKDKFQNMAELVEFNSPEKVKDLLDRNLTLSKRLQDAQDQVAKLEAEKTDNEEQMSANLREIEKLRTEIAQVKVRLGAIHDENTGYRRRISDLNTKLTNAEIELANLSKQPEANPEMIAENKLLKDTITNQLTALKTQQQALDLLIEAHKNNNSDDPNIDMAMKVLADKSALELTPAEEAIVKAINTAPADESEGNSIATAFEKQIEVKTLGNLAEETFKKGLYSAAEQLYRNLLDEQPDHFAARVNLGTILIKRKLVPEAIDHLKRANEITPGTAPVVYMLGVAHYLNGSDKEAMAAFQETVSLEPDNTQAYVYMGNIESSAGNYDQAVGYYDSALKITPTMTDALFNKAWTLANSGKITKARQAYDLAIHNGALPDMELQRILDPAGTTLPVQKTPKQEPAAPADLEAPAPIAPEALVEKVDPKPQASPVKDASVIPTEVASPAPTKEPDSLALVSTSSNPPVSADNPVAAAKTQAPTKKTEPATVKQTAAKVTTASKPEAEPKAEPKEEPKPRRKFRFG